MNWLRHVTDPKKDENNQKNYAKDYVEDYEEMKLHLVLNTSKDENMSRMSPSELVIASLPLAVKITERATNTTNSN